MIDAISQLGVLLLLLLTGMETDLAMVRKVGRAAISVSIMGICLPFLCGLALGQCLPDALLPNPEQRFIASLFLGTALSISSVKIVAMVVQEMMFMRRNVGQMIVASAIIDDTIGWIIIAIILSLAAHGRVDLSSLARSVLGTAVFLVLSYTIGRRLVFTLIRWANDNLVSEAPVIAVILLLTGGLALTTHLIGVHTVLGAFVAGILVGESPILTRKIDQQLRGLIMGLFMPVFFGRAGLSADLTILKDPVLLGLTGALIVIASLGKFAGAFIGGRLGGLTGRESLALGCGLNARGSTEIIVSSIGLSMGVISQSLFTMIVAMAVITTMAMPPMLRRALGRLPLGNEEKARLDREEFESKGFVANLQRLLLAVDESANGKFASRLAGLIVGARSIPTTVLHIGPNATDQEKYRLEEQSVESAVRAAAESTAAVEATETNQTKVNVITRSKVAGAEEAVASEARKGYDFLVIGIENTMAEKGGFHEEMTRVAAGFEGPLGVVVARGDHVNSPINSGFKILVPVTGTDVSRRAAEVAVTLARANGTSITALYVANLKGANKNPVRRRDALAARGHGEAFLKNVVTLADRYGVNVRTAVRIDVAAEEAILSEARRGSYDFIVMGGNRRAGDVLYLGDVAAAILQKSTSSVLFISS